LPADFRAGLPVSCAIARNSSHIEYVAAAPFPIPVLSPPSVPVAPPFWFPVAPRFWVPVALPSRIPVAYAHFPPRPVTIIIEPWANRKADTEGQRRSPIRRIRLSVLRLLIVHKDDLRIILWNINDFGFGRDNANISLFFDHLLLWGIDKGACRSSLRAELLDGIHDVRRLIEEGLAELRGPFEVLIHPFHNIRIANE
jgi:hypothetical protein